MRHAVLIVEDEAVFAKNMQTYLAREGFEARVAGDADAAMREFETFRPGIVLLDYNLPGADGLAVLARMKAKDANVQVIMLTGRGSVEVKVQAMNSGAADYLSKPVALSELKRMILRLLEL